MFKMHNLHLVITTTRISFAKIQFDIFNPTYFSTVT